MHAQSFISNDFVMIYVQSDLRASKSALVKGGGMKYCMNI